MRHPHLLRTSFDAGGRRSGPQRRAARAGERSRPGSLLAGGRGQGGADPPRFELRYQDEETGKVMRRGQAPAGSRRPPRWRVTGPALPSLPRFSGPSILSPFTQLALAIGRQLPSAQAVVETLGWACQAAPACMAPRCPPCLMLMGPMPSQPLTPPRRPQPRRAAAGGGLPGRPRRPRRPLARPAPALPAHPHVPHRHPTRPAPRAQPWPNVASQHN